MKYLVFFSLLFNLSSAWSAEESFFYVNFSECKENFTNFSRKTGLDNNPKPKHNLVCSQKNKKIECKLLDEKGKLIKTEAVTRDINMNSLSVFKGDTMSISVLKVSGGVFMSWTTATSLETMSQLVCIGEIRDATDLKDIQVKKQMLNGPQQPAKKNLSPPEDIEEPLIGD